MRSIQLFGLASSLAFSFAPVGTLHAQCSVVSPPGQAGTDDTNDSTTLPLLHDTPRRYLQIHSDLMGLDVNFKRLSLRRDQSSGNGTGFRRVHLELSLGDTVSFDRPSWVFAANYTGPRTQVIARRFVDLPNLTSVGTPSAFEMPLTFDVPWHYAGTQSFAWDMSVYETEAWGDFATRLDAYGSSVVLAESTQIGLGCFVAGKVAPMTHSISIADCAGILTFGGMVDSMPADSPCLLMLGAANPNAVLPGLCSPVYTDLMLALPLGVSDANGYLGEDQYGDKAPGGSFGFAFVNTFPGATIYSQVHALDMGSSWAFPIANSDGRSWTVPASDLTKLNRVTRLYNDDSNPDGTRAVWVGDRNIGFGAVVKFSY